MPIREERRTCPRCSKAFMVNLGAAGRPAEYCSTVCRRAVANQNAALKKSGVNQSDAVALAAPRGPRACDWCGNEFTPPARGPEAHYCKKSCANLASRARVKNGDRLLLDRDDQAWLETSSKTLSVPVNVIIGEALAVYRQSPAWDARKRAYLDQLAKL